MLFLKTDQVTFVHIHYGVNYTGLPCEFNLLYNGYRVFPGGKERPGCNGDPSPPSIAVVKKE